MSFNETEIRNQISNQVYNQINNHPRVLALRQAIAEAKAITQPTEEEQITAFAKEIFPLPADEDLFEEENDEDDLTTAFETYNQHVNNFAEHVNNAHADLDRITAKYEDFRNKLLRALVAQASAHATSLRHLN